MTTEDDFFVCVNTIIESAFRLLPVHPDDFCLLGMKIMGKIWIDKAIPMGASSSPALFEKFSSFIEWAAKRETNTETICHFADDFLIVGSDNESEGASCFQQVKTFEKVCAKLGVPLAADKAEGPVTKIVYLGLEIDSIQQLISIPNEKLLAIRQKVEKALAASKLTLKELQSLIGSLSFVCKAVTPGRPFLRRLIDLTCGIKRAWYKIRLSEGAKCDLKMWLIFLNEFNGASIIPDQMWHADSDLQLYTDASGEIGVGGYFQGRWFQERWPESCSGSNRNSIAWMEFFPIVVAVVLWGEWLKGKRIVLRSDNTSVVAILNKQTSKCPKIMKLLRFFVLQCLKLNLGFCAKHIPGKENVIADALSRFQMVRFREVAPNAEVKGTPVPKFLWNL